jgi:hypothetical protein
VASGKTATPSALLAFHNPSKDFTTLELKKKLSRCSLCATKKKKIFLESSSTCAHTKRCTLFVKWCPQTDMPSEKGAICVQRFDGSQSSAIHTTYRISLRSSSMREPRDPLLKVFFLLIILLILKNFVCLVQIHERVG